MKLEDLNLSVRTYSTLKRADIHFVEDLIQYTIEDLGKIRHIAAKSVLEIEQKLSDHNIHLTKAPKTKPAL